MQVQAAINTFIENFQTAIRPQIIKTYASSEFHYMHTLVVASSKYGFFLTLVLVCPIMLCIQPILMMWLGTVPAHTDDFIHVILGVALLWPLRGAMIDAIHATGDIKKFQLYEGTVLLLIVPIAYLLLKFWHVEAEVVFWVYFLIEFVTQIFRIWIVLPKIKMSFSFYFKEVFRPISLLFLLSFIPLFFIKVSVEETFWYVILYLLLFGGYILLCIFFCGLRKSERNLIFKVVSKQFSVFKKL